MLRSDICLLRAWALQINRSCIRVLHVEQCVEETSQMGSQGPKSVSERLARCKPPGWDAAASALQKYIAMWEMSAGKRHEMRLQESTKNAVRNGLPTSQEGETGGGLGRQLAGLEIGKGALQCNNTHLKQFLRKMSAPLAKPHGSNHSPQAFDRNSSYSSVILG